MEEQLSKSLQENILVLLCYSDKNCRFIRNVVDTDLFESPYREVVKRCYTYIDSYDEPPKDHIGDLLEDLLEDEKKSKIYIRVLENLIRSKDNVSEKYTLDRLDKFIRQQSLKSGILEAAEALNDQSEPDLDSIESSLSNKMKKRLDVFDGGSVLSNANDIIKIFQEEEHCFPTGIEALDRANLGPIRGGLNLFIGGPKSGKSTWMVNLGRQSLLQGYNVLVVTLEMSETYYLKRFIQNMCAVPKSPMEVVVPGFSTDSNGNIQDVVFKNIKFQQGLTSKGIDKKIIDKVSRWKAKRKNLVIKQFPTGSLTVKELRAYLDRLEESQGFIPDLVLVDYADIMKVEADNYRIALGNVYKDLRGIAVERDIAVATASQSNREGVKSKKVNETSVAEDFSKIGTADCVLAFNKTEVEDKLGLGRILVAAARNDSDKFEVGIAQNYNLCQFVVDSIGITNSYHDLMQDIAESQLNDL